MKKFGGVTGNSARQRTVQKVEIRRRGEATSDVALVLDVPGLVVAKLELVAVGVGAVDDAVEAVVNRLGLMAVRVELR